VYTTCLRCERPLGANHEIPHLPVGRRIAFDTTTGRLWIVCRRCGQWNLTPIEERWEALAECERLAGAAEARAAGRVAGLAQTTSGLELLRVGGMPDADIANWRYGRRLRARQRRLTWVLLTFAALAVALGIGAARVSGALAVGAYLAVFACAVLFRLWYEPPRPWVRIPDGADGHLRLWPWELQGMYFDTSNAAAPPVLVIPTRGGLRRLRGAAAADVLAGLLPKINGADCTGVALPDVVERVSQAERDAARPPRPPGRGAHRRARERGHEPVTPAPRRPWERVVEEDFYRWVTSAPPESRLALEMAVTEEIERRAMAAQADALAEEWRGEEEIGEIADTLLLPDDISARLEELHARRAGSAGADRSAVTETARTDPPAPRPSRNRRDGS
jgi:hypothetical protein